MKTLEQEEINHMNTRKAWDKTIEERDSLKNEVAALKSIKTGLENSLLTMNSKVDNVIRILREDKSFTGSIDKKVTLGHCIDLIKNEFER